MIFALLFLLSLVIGAVIYFTNRKFKFFDSFGGFMLGLGFSILIPVLILILLEIPASFSAPYNKWQLLQLYFILSIGLAQLIYIIPLVFWLNKTKQYDMMKGVITGAVLIALLNGSCFMFVMPNIGRIAG